MGTVGNDQYGRKIVAKMREFGLPSLYVQTLNAPTTIATVELDENGEREFRFAVGATGAVVDENSLPAYDALVLASATAFLGGALLVNYRQLLTHAAAARKPVVFDPNFRIDLYKDQIPA